MLGPQRTHPIIYLLIINKFTTMLELRELDIDEVLDLYEACLISIYNKDVVLKGGRQQ